MTQSAWDIWDQAQAAEKGHWAALWEPAESVNRQHLASSEAQKGDFIFAEMTKHFGVDATRDWASKAVLDVGCGPVSLVARGKLGQTREGVDPLRYPHWVYESYKANDFSVHMEPFEEFHNTHSYDVIVMYNALQHFADLTAVAKRAKTVLSVDGEVFLSEYLEVPTNDAHIQFLKADGLTKTFKAVGFNVDADTISVRLPDLVERPGGTPIDLYVARLTCKS